MEESHMHTQEVGTLLQDVLDEMLEGMQIISHNWQYIYVNEIVARQGKRTKGELIGRTMMECYPGIEKTPLFSTLRACMEEGTSKRFENEFVFPDGAAGCFELFIHPVEQGLLILSVDITQRRRLEEELKEKMREVDILLDSTTDREVKIAQLRAEMGKLKALFNKESVEV